MKESGITESTFAATETFVTLVTPPSTAFWYSYIDRGGRNKPNLPIKQIKKRNKSQTVSQYLVSNLCPTCDKK